MEPWDFCPLGNLCFWLPVKSVLELAVAPGDENLFFLTPLFPPHIFPWVSQSCLSWAGL